MRRPLLLLVLLPLAAIVALVAHSWSSDPHAGGRHADAGPGDPGAEHARASRASLAEAPPAARARTSPGAASPSAAVASGATARASSGAASGPGPRPPETPAGPGPWGEAPPPLRAVTGVVRDAVSGAPVPDAWVAWRYADREAREKILADLPEDASGFTMLTDALGRFRLDRLPDGERVSSRVFAVARGYAPGSEPAGLGREVVIELRPLAPGEQADEWRKVRLEARIDGPSGPVAGARVILMPEAAPEGERGDPSRTSTDAEGRFSIDLPAVSYSVYVQRAGGDSFRPVGFARPGEAEARLWLEERDLDVRLEVRIGGEPLAKDRLELVSLGTTPPDLLVLRAEERGVFTGRAPQGPALLFRDTTLLAELDLPGDARRSLDLSEVQVALRFDVPADLRDGEVVRGEAAVVPLALYRHAALRALFAREAGVRFTASRGGPALAVQLVARARYVFVGTTDIGWVNHTFEAPDAGGDIRIPILAR